MQVVALAEAPSQDHCGGRTHRERSGNEREMNIIRQREYLKQLCWKFKLIDPSFLKAALTCPCFDMTASKKDEWSDDEIGFLKQEIMAENGVPKVSPYPVFRFFTRVYFDQWFHFPKDKQWLGVRVMYDKEGPDVWLFTIYSEEAKGENSVRVFNDGKPFTQEQLKKRGATNEQLDDLLWSPNRALAFFLFQCMFPANKIIRVEPKDEKASVEWRLARTHYLILHQKQAAICSKQRQGVSEQMIVRAAHWRRAHFRRLMSEVFKEKRGKLIPIKHAWVGPTEWTGNDHKIYKIMNP